MSEVKGNYTDMEKIVNAGFAVCGRGRHPSIYHCAFVDNPSKRTGKLLD